MSRRTRFAPVAIAWLCTGLAACGANTATQRVVAGRTLSGEYISPEAYAAVFQAELLQAQGQLEPALAAFQRAGALAPDSPGVWTNLGALACELKHGDDKRAFAKAEDLDPHFEPLWRARANCALSKAQNRVALQAAQRAVALDPTSAEDTQLVSLALTRLHDERGKVRWQTAFTLQQSLSHSEAAKETQWAAAPSRLRKQRNDQAPDATLDSLNQALRADDLFSARNQAASLHLSSSDLALRALRLGLLQAALNQAQLTLSANPLDSDARVVALCSADLLHDESRFRSFLILPINASELSAPAHAELDALLSRRSLRPLAAPDAQLTQ
ncbi:MAG TPA: hypothetical protein VL137_14365 [Polyangiaceae bacterium]|nr:hypothetical protein [Polyangiaceae bacterium]